MIKIKETIPYKNELLLGCCWTAFSPKDIHYISCAPDFLASNGLCKAAVQPKSSHRSKSVRSVRAGNVRLRHKMNNMLQNIAVNPPIVPNAFFSCALEFGRIATGLWFRTDSSQDTQPEMSRLFCFCLFAVLSG